MSRRMIVAVYVEGIPLWSPIHPVDRIERLTPQGRESRNTNQDENSFAAILNSIMKKTKQEDSNGFDFHA